MSVYLARQPRYDVTEIRQNLEDALTAIGAAPRSKHAVIKPNLVNQFGDTSWTTTHPGRRTTIGGRVIEELLRELANVVRPRLMVVDRHRGGRMIAERNASAYVLPLKTHESKGQA